jgi:hypothetical protein
MRAEGERMRIVRPVIVLLVALLIAAAALAYMERQARQEWATGHTSNYPADTTPDTVRIVTGNPDPYLQCYYSESEGWTYYTLPSDSSARPSGER